MSADYKLILISDNTGGTKIRYRKKDDVLYTTLYLKETDSDKVIDILLKKFKKNG